MSGRVSIDRILDKLDEYLHKNDYDGAKRHLLYWLSETQAENDDRAELLVRNELMGLYRKLGMEQKAIECAEASIEKITAMGIAEQAGAGTTYLNCATVYKAFGQAERALPIFENAREIYERELSPEDKRLGGLYNNMALALVDLGRFGEAYELYNKAISVMQGADNGALEVAITHLNIATAKEAELGLEMADEQIQERLKKAQELLDGELKRDGYYAFVCEKCASVFNYYGHFFYENELKERARRIYEGN